MKVNELRIGNLVYDRGNKILKIDYWERKDLIAQKVVVEGFVGHPLTEYVEYLKPIPLTEEWLLKFGFEKKKGYYDRYYYSIDGMDIRIDADMFETEVGECLYKTIKYVHQLQNLYFAINDEELTMK